MTLGRYKITRNDEGAAVFKDGELTDQFFPPFAMLRAVITVLTRLF